MKKIISATLLLVFMVSTIFGTNVFAASWPTLSKSGYCEFTATQKIPVFRDTACKTRGTCAPAKTYSDACITKGDICYIYKITSSYVQVNYPTSSGRRTGYIKRSALFSKSSPASPVTSKSQVTTYISPKGSNYGYTEKGDKVYVCSEKDNYYGIIYTAISGNRDYKFGWVLKSEYNNKIVKVSDSSSSSSSSTRKSLASVAANEVGYKAYGKDKTKYGNWFKNNGVQWCAIFVSWCVNRAGVSTAIVPKTAVCNVMQEESKSYVKWSKKAINNINKNDVIFFSSNGGQDTHHVGIVESVSGSKITLIEGNSSDDRVKRNTYTVSNLSTGKIKNGRDSWAYFCGYIPVK